MRIFRHILFFFAALALSGCPTGLPARPKLVAEVEIPAGASFDFGWQYVAASAETAVQLRNRRGGPATSLTAAFVSSSDPEFGFKGGAYPGIGGDCSDKLESEAICTLVITYSPAASTNSAAAAMAITYGGGGTGSLSFSFAAKARTRAALSVAEAPSYDFGSILKLNPLEHTFTITNSGETAASAISATLPAGKFDFKGGAFPGTGGDCATTLAAGASCHIVLAFLPDAVSAFTSSLNITYATGVSGAALALPLAGNGVAAAVTISDGPTYDFGARYNGTTIDKTFTVLNTSLFTASAFAAGSALASPYSFKGGTFPGIGGNCGPALLPAQSCLIVVTFAPLVSGPTTASLDVNFFDGGSTVMTSRALAGTGQSPASLTISGGPTYDFGTQILTSNTDATFTVTNGGIGMATGITPTALAAPFAFKGGPFPGTGGDCGAMLAGGGACTIVVTFTPSMSGLANATLRLDYSDGLVPQNSTRAMRGTGIAAASLSISDGATYDFGTQYLNPNLDKTFTVTNTGPTGASALAAGIPALGSPFMFKGGTGYPGSGGTCAGTLAPSASCTVVVNYNPGSAATSSDTLRIAFHDGLNPQTATRAITGRSIVPAALTISDGPTYDFGRHALASNTDKVFTVTNSGPIAATALAGSPAPSAPYSFKDGSFPGTGGDCTSPLAPAGTCHIVVTFTPTVGDGPQNGSVSVSYNDGKSAIATARALTGKGPINTQSVNIDGMATNAAFAPINSLYDFEKDKAWTFCEWVKRTTEYPGDLGGHFNSATAVGVDLYDALSQVQLTILDDTSASLRVVSPALPAATWTHVCAAYDGSNSTSGMFIWYNGVAQSLSPQGSPLVGSTATNTPFTIGVRYGGSPSYGFFGLITQVLLYDTKLTNAEISALYNSGDPADPRLLSTLSHALGYWPIGFGATTSSSFEEVIHGNNAAPTGSLIYSTDHP